MKPQHFNLFCRQAGYPVQPVGHGRYPQFVLRMYIAFIAKLQSLDLSIMCIADREMDAEILFYLFGHILHGLPLPRLWFGIIYSACKFRTESKGWANVTLGKV